MFYYEIKMNVEGPYICSCPVSEEDGFESDHPAVVATKKAEINLMASIKIAKENFPKIGVKVKHAYMWPDGSLYFFASTEDVLKIDSLPGSLKEHVAGIRKINGSDDPGKVFAKTVAEYMEQD